MKKLGFAIVGLLLVAGFALAAEITDPILITSIGQSADITTAKLMFKKAGVDSAQLVVNKLATAKNIPAKGGTVVMVVGASNKGLGEARISADGEVARAKALIEAAHKNDVKVVLFHIGGKERRGGQSEPMCQAVADGADYFLVKKGGDEDGFFAKIAKENKKTYETYTKVPEGITTIKKAYEQAAAETEKPAKTKK